MTSLVILLGIIKVLPISVYGFVIVFAYLHAVYAAKTQVFFASQTCNQ